MAVKTAHFECGTENAAIVCGFCKHIPAIFIVASFEAIQCLVEVWIVMLECGIFLQYLLLLLLLLQSLLLVLSSWDITALCSLCGCWTIYSSRGNFSLNSLLQLITWEPFQVNSKFTREIVDRIRNTRDVLEFHQF